LPTISTGVQIAYNLQSNLLLAKLLQLAYTRPQICNPLLFAYNFNWHTNCLQFATRCSLPTTSNVIQRPAICNPFVLCLQLLLAFKCPQFAIRCSLPTTTSDIQIARKFAIRLLFAYNYHFATRFLDLHLLRAQCLRKVNSDFSQIICGPCHTTNCILSARHALISMLSQYSDPVQAFENVILTIYSETHLITLLESLPSYVNVLNTIWPFCNRIYSFDAVRGCFHCCTMRYI